MDVLSSIVKSVVIIAFLTLFLEILLPSGNMKRYSKFVMGLLILVVVINPLLKVFSDDLPAVNLKGIDYDGSTAVTTQDIIDQGNALGGELQNQGESYYQESLVKQIKSIVRLIDGVEDAMVEVVLNEEHNLTDVIIVLTIEKAKAVKGGNATDKPQFTEDTVREIRQKTEEAVGDFYDIPPERIQVSISSYAN